MLQLDFLRHQVKPPVYEWVAYYWVVGQRGTIQASTAASEAIAKGIGYFL